MAKIENTTVYPTVTPAMDDYIVGTDVSDDNKTVTFLVSDIAGGGGGLLQGLQSVLDENNAATQDINLSGHISLLGGPGVAYLDLCQIYLSGNVGAPGQVLTSQGIGACATWTTPGAAGCCALKDVLAVGNTTGGNDILTTGSMYFSGANQLLQLTNGTDLDIDGSGSILLSPGTTINDAAGSTGLVNQVLTWDGSDIVWADPNLGSCCSIQSTATAGNTLTAIGLSFVGPSTTTFDASSQITSAANNVWSGTNTFSGDLDIDGALEDVNGSVGVAGQILSSTGAGVAWINNTAAPTLQNVLDAGNTATEDINLTGIIDLTGSLVLGANTTISANASVGTPGQYLTATATGVEWTSLSTNCCPLDDVLVAGNTSANSILLSGAANVTAPSMTPGFLVASNGTGSAGQILQTNGASIEWVNAPGGMSGFDVRADSGANLPIANNDILSIIGQVGNNPIYTKAVAVDTVEVHHDLGTGLAGTYTNATVTVDQYGHVAAISGATPTDTTYDLTSQQNGSNSNVNLIGSDGTTDTVQIIAGTNITITDTGNAITIDAAGGGGGMTSFDIADSAAGSQTIVNGDKITFVGGTGLTSSVTAVNTVTFDLDNTTVAAGSYTNADITVNAQGQITAASNGTGGGGSTATYTSAQNGANVDMTYAQTSPTVTDVVSLVAGSNITLTDNGANQITVASSAGGGTMSSFEVQADAGGNETIVDGDKLQFLGGSGISTAMSNPDIVTITNTGVLSIIAGAGISVNQAAGNVTVTATGGGGGGSNIIRASRGFYSPELKRTSPGLDWWLYENPMNPTQALPTTGFTGMDLIGYNIDDPQLTNPSNGSNIINASVFRGMNNNCLGQTYRLCSGKVTVSHTMKTFEVYLYKKRICQNELDVPTWYFITRCFFVQSPGGLNNMLCCELDLTATPSSYLDVQADEAIFMSIHSSDGTLGGMNGTIDLEFNPAP
jgi:hypothetical protein